jgi:outer membrane protein TolC
MFKPRIDFGLSLPSWNEMVTPIQQPDGLPVYNSTGSMRFSGDLSFTYMLPTGGNLALSSTIYRDNLSAILASQDYKTLKTNKAYSRFAISFNQPIFTANKLRENLQEAKYYHERSSSRFTRGQMDIIYEVTKGFYTLYRATREVEIANEKLKNAQDALKTAQILSENGRIPEVDVLITKVDLAESQANFSENMNKLEREKDSFKNLIGLSIDEDIQIITDLKYEKFNIDMDKAIHSALKYRLELRESNIDIELQKIEVDRAKRFTEFSGNISAYYDFTGVSTIDSRSTRELFYSSFDNFIERRPNRGITMTISYPIFDWGRGSARVQEQKAKLRNRELYLENTQNEITREVRDIVRSVEETKNRLNIYEQNQQVAELTYRISKMRFESGDINSRELALEQERLSKSRLAYLNAYITYQLTVADLKRKTLWDFYNGRSYLQEITGADAR